MQSSPNFEKRIVAVILLFALTAFLLVWLLCKLGLPVLPMLAQGLAIQ